MTKVTLIQGLPDTKEVDKILKWLWFLLGLLLQLSILNIALGREFLSDSLEVISESPKQHREIVAKALDLIKERGTQVPRGWQGQRVNWCSRVNLASLFFLLVAGLVCTCSISELWPLRLLPSLPHSF